MDVKDGFKRLMLDVGCEECMALARVAGIEPGDCGASDGECRACAERTGRALAGRMMPEGMEWPRFEDGEPVRIGDEVQGMDAAHVVRFVRLAPDGWTLHDGDVLVIDEGERGERVKRPPPLPRDAYGEPVMVGDRVWLVPEKRRFCGESTEDCSLLGIEPGQTLCVAKLGRHTVTMEQLSASCPACWLTHEEPDTQEAIDRDACLDPFEYVDRVMCKTFRDMSRSDARKEKFRYLLDRQLRLFREEEGR